MSEPTGSQRVYLHVGVPKSGTTFLQDALLHRCEALRKAGVLYPGGNERMFLAALDVRGDHKAWGRTRSQVQGSWDELVRRARAHQGITVVSHELLAAASARQIAAAMTMLTGLEVHVVVTARDPARQAVAEWQEGIKHGRRLTFEEFRRRVLDGAAETDYARRFRAAHDLPDVLARWGSAVPMENVHVVTCPGPTAPGELLWQRFADVVGFDVLNFEPVGPEPVNASMGIAEINLLRRVNLALDKRIPQPGYGDVVTRLYAPLLRTARRSPRPVVPLEMLDDLTVVGERWVKEIDKAGYPVHGSLGDLVPVTPKGPARHPDDVDPREQVEIAAASTAELLVELHHTRAEVARLQTGIQKQKKRRKRLKRRLARAADR